MRGEIGDAKRGRGKFGVADGMDSEVGVGIQGEACRIPT